jgi:hypothetical protein
MTGKLTYRIHELGYFISKRYVKIGQTKPTRKKNGNSVVNTNGLDQQTDEKNQRRTVIYLPLRELPGRADDAPHDRRSAKYLRRGTYESVLLIGVADPWYVRKHPGQNAQLRRPRDDRRDNLRREHRPRRDFHVLPQLEVGGEGQRLRHSGVAPGLEEHRGDGFARAAQAQMETCINGDAESKSVEDHTGDNQ